MGVIPQIRQVQCPACRHVFKPFFVEKATRGAKRVSRGVTWAVGTNMLTLGRALDYGCGFMRNTPFLEQHFNRVDCLDTPIQCERLREMYPGRAFLTQADPGAYDAVWVVSVVHILPTERERINVLRAAADAAMVGGHVIVEVPTWESYYRDSAAQRYGDGYAMGGGQFPTFYRPFSATDLKQLVRQAGLQTVAKNVVKTTTTLICERER